MIDGPVQSSVGGTAQPAPQAQGLDSDLAAQLITAITNRVQAIVQPVVDRMDSMEARMNEVVENAALGTSHEFGPGVPDDWKNSDPAMRNNRGIARSVTIMTRPAADNPEMYNHVVAGVPFPRGSRED